MARTPAVGPILMRHGLSPGPDGFAYDDLVAVANSHGWRVEVEEGSARQHGYRRIPSYAALIFVRAALAHPTQMVTARGRGETAAAALAQALARMLTHEA